MRIYASSNDRHRQLEPVRRESPCGYADASTVLRALRDGQVPEAGQVRLVRAAAAYGWRLDQPHTGIALAYTGAQHRRWASALSWLGQPMAVEGARAWTLLPGDADRAVSQLRFRLEQMVGAGEVRVASGPPVTGPGATTASLRAADRLLDLLLHQVGETRAELPFDQAGLAQLLLTVPDERLRWFVRRHLGPIAHRDDLLRTLDCWLATSGSRQAVSQRLHLHRNSVGYRVGLIKRLLGVDPLDPDTAAVLRAALTARELLASGATGD